MVNSRAWRRGRNSLWLSLAVLLLLLAPGRSRQPDRLIVLSRHGVRRQFPSGTHDFALYAPGKDFAVDDMDWGVDGSMGVLTQHGYDAAKRMGFYQGQRYAAANLPLASCDDMFLYCEEDMPRDEFTAEAFFKGFAEGWGSQGGGGSIPDCAPPPPESAGVEYLIDQGSAPRNDGKCRLATEQEVEGIVGSVDEYTRLFRPQLEKLNDVLGCCDRSVCPADLPADKECTLLDIPHQWDAEHWYVTFIGPIYAGKYFSEWFLLNYLNGMDYAWGKLTEADVLDLAAFVTEYRHFEFDLLAARPFGSTLLMHILATLEQWASGEQVPGLSHNPKANMVYHAAHDTNLLYIAELLDLKWVSKGWQPNHTPPGGELVFEAYEEGGEWFVAAFFDTATPSQVRELTELTLSNPPDRVAVTIPGCSSKDGNDLLCPLAKFRSIVLRAVDPDCVNLPKLADFMSSLWERDPVVVAAAAAATSLVPSQPCPQCPIPPDTTGEGAAGRDAGAGGDDCGPDVSEGQSEMLTLAVGVMAGLVIGAVGFTGCRLVRGSSAGGVPRFGRAGGYQGKVPTAGGLRNRGVGSRSDGDDVELLQQQRDGV